MVLQRVHLELVGSGAGCRGGGEEKEVVNESRWRSPHRNVIIHKQKGYFGKYFFYM